MKPLSELVKEWRLDSEKLSGDARLVNQGCADELQAWLREADSEEMPDWFEKALLKLFPDEMYRFMLGTALWRKVRLNLLGTTRQEGAK
jgi:hypothetical protein